MTRVFAALVYFSYDQVCSQKQGRFHERSANVCNVECCCKSIVCVLECHWPVAKNGRNPLFSINVLIGFLCSKWPGSSIRTVRGIAVLNAFQNIHLEAMKLEALFR